jgi:hypothetical protein
MIVYLSQYPNFRREFNSLLSKMTIQKNILRHRNKLVSPAFSCRATLPAPPTGREMVAGAPVISPLDIPLAPHFFPANLQAVRNLGRGDALANVVP